MPDRIWSGICFFWGGVGLFAASLEGGEGTEAEDGHGCGLGDDIDLEVIHSGICSVGTRKQNACDVDGRLPAGPHKVARCRCYGLNSADLIVTRIEEREAEIFTKCGGEIATEFFDWGGQGQEGIVRVAEFDPETFPGPNSSRAVAGDAPVCSVTWFVDRQTCVGGGIHDALATEYVEGREESAI